VNHTVTIRRFNGDEVFRVKEAKIDLAQRADGVELSLRVQGGPAIRTVSDTESAGALPVLELVVRFSHRQLQRLTREVFTVPLGERDGEVVASLYYFEHQVLDENVFRVMNLTSETMLVDWRATTTDVNHYDGLKPRASVHVRARCRVSLPNRA
jgi:hypothetical protein